MIDELYSHAYCSESLSLIENYDKAIADTTQTWICHHRLELHDDYRNSIEDLKLMNLYYNRPASELIYLTRSEHTTLHMTGKRRIFTDEHRRKLSEAKLNTKRPKSVCNKISKAVKGHKYNVINGIRVRNKEAD